MYRFVVKLIQICYTQFCINLDTFGCKFVFKIQIEVYTYLYVKRQNFSSLIFFLYFLISSYAGIQNITTKEYGVHAKHMEKVCNLYSYSFRQCTYSQLL
jgi:hypothetical protein